MPGLIAAAVLCVTPVVHDGDSIRCGGTERVRIANIDAPELNGSPRCAAPRRPSAWCDHAAAIAARDALRALLRKGAVRIVRLGQDGYGRTLARVFVGDQDVGEWLIRQDLARRWR